MTVGPLINSILQINRELEQQQQVMTTLSTQVEGLRNSISTHFSDTNIATKLATPLEKTKTALSTAIPESAKAKETLLQLTAKLRG